MWVSVLRAKVKPVAGVVEVGRIRVTDQRAPREPVPGKSLRRLQRGPWVSSRARIASKTRARCTRLSACLFVFLPSFVLFLPSFVLFLSPFAPLRVSFAPSDHLEFLLSFPRAFLSFSLHDRPAFSFTPYYPSPIVRAQLSILFRCSRATLSTTFRSVFSSSLSLLFPILSLYFPLIPSFVPCSFPSRCTRLLPTCLTT